MQHSSAFAAPSPCTPHLHMPQSQPHSILKPKTIPNPQSSHPQSHSLLSPPSLCLSFPQPHRAQGTLGPQQPPPPPPPGLGEVNMGWDSPHPWVGLNAFLLNPYKTEYKILASTMVIKENFNPAVSVHLVHTVKCLLVVGFFSSFLILWFFFSPLFLFPSQPQAEAAGYNASAQLWQSSSIVKRRKSPHFH